MAVNDRTSGVYRFGSEVKPIIFKDLAMFFSVNAKYAATAEMSDDWVMFGASCSNGRFCATG
ncbi:MAG: hypothetical protein ABJN65_06940 [Parasphingorhabdus sp.]